MHIPEHGAGLLQYIWEQRDGSASQWCILPNGQVNLIFMLDHRVRLVRSLKLTAANDPLRHFAFLSGLHTKPLHMRFSGFHVMGVAMSPVAVKALFGIPACEVRDGAVEGGLILRELPLLEDRLNTLGTFSERAIFLEHLLLRLVHESADLHTALRLGRTMEHLAQRCLLGTGTGLEQRLGYSRTHAFRLANEWYGCSMQGSQRLQQFVHAVGLLHRPEGSLTSIGLEAGYYDQAHFIRAFRDFADMTPGAYRKRMGGIPGQLQS